MSIADGVVNDLKMADVLTFLTVHRCRSISAAARELMVTPSQVSKSIARLEELLGVDLMARSPQGVELLDEGRRVVPQFEQMLALTRDLRRGTATTSRVLTCAAPSYVATALVPHIAELEPGFRIRTLELPPAQVRNHLSSGHFEIAISLGELPLQPSWESHQVGLIEKALFASPATAARLGPGPLTREQLLEVPFVSPVYLTERGFLPIDDDCPITRRERRVGHETMTMALALALVARTDQVVFGPLLGALPFLASGQVVKLKVVDWRSSDILYLAYNTERITGGEHRTLLAAIETAMQQVAPFCDISPSPPGRPALGKRIADERIAAGQA